MSKDFEKKLAELKCRDRAELVAEWQRIKGSLPPKNTSLQFMVRVISYHWQEEAHGSLPRRVEQQI